MSPASGAGRCVSRLDGLLARLDRLLDDVASFADRRAAWCLGAFSLFYFVSTLCVIRARPLWLDEIATYCIARLPIPGIVRALYDGADGQPPFFSFTVHPLAMTGIPVLVRIPSMIGLWLMAVCIYRFVSRRGSKLQALIATLFPFITAAEKYSYEGRPYGIVLGGSAAALLCWQRLDSGRYRSRTLIAMWLCCTVVVASHYYGFLILLPLAAGELARWRTQKPDYKVAVALAASLLPLVIGYPIVRSVRLSGAHFWGHVSLHSLGDAYEELLAPAILPLSMILVALLLIGALVRSGSRERSEPLSEWPLPVPELVAIAGFALLPFAGVALGVVSGAMVPRYVIASLIGIGIGLTLLLSRHRRVGAVVFLVLGLFVTGTFALQVLQWRHVAEGGRVPSAAIAVQQEPIVYQGSHEFIQTHFYAPSAVADRMFYLTSPQIALRRTRQNSNEYFIQALCRTSDCHVEEYSSFLSGHRRFIVVAGIYNEYPWLLSELMSDGLEIRVLSTSGDETVYEVSAVAGG